MLLGRGTHTSLGEVRDAESTHEWFHFQPVLRRQRETVQVRQGPGSDHCETCNRDNHKREDCKLRTHPDINERGQLDGSLPDRAI